MTIHRDTLGYMGGAPKEEIDICLSCPLTKPMCESNSCPLVIQRLARSRKRRGKKHDRQGTDQGAAGDREQKQASLA